MCSQAGETSQYVTPFGGKTRLSGSLSVQSFKKTSSFLNWEEKLFLPGAVSPQIDYISESPGTLGETQIPEYQPGLTESESPFFPYSPPGEAGRTGIRIVHNP